MERNLRLTQKIPIPADDVRNSSITFMNKTSNDRTTNSSQQHIKTTAAIVSLSVLKASMEEALSES